MSYKDRSVRKMGRKDLQNVIDLCRSIRSRGLNPFLVNVNDLIEILRKYFPDWESPEDLCLDAEALNEIASVIRLQSEWVQKRSSSLYTDPFILEEKIRTLSSNMIAEIFLSVWHPIAELEQLSIKSLENALAYWDSLLPIEERLRRERSAQLSPGRITHEELIQLGLLVQETFQEEMRKLWNELKEKASENGKVQYWDFIGADTYIETIKRAYLTSFLVTYGYAKMELYPLEDEVYLQPLREPEVNFPEKESRKEKPTSLPIPISYKEWMTWRRNRKEDRGEEEKLTIR